jgi:uncharacterized protein (DUF736 family)
MRSERSKLFLAGMAAGVILAVAVTAAIRIVPAANAQAPQANPGPGPYQMAAWSTTDQQGNSYSGYFVLDTRTGLVTDSDYDTATLMHNKTKR